MCRSQEPRDGAQAQWTKNLYWSNPAVLCRNHSGRTLIVTKSERAMCIARTSKKDGVAALLTCVISCRHLLRRGSSALCTLDLYRQPNAWCPTQWKPPSLPTPAPNDCEVFQQYFCSSDEAFSLAFIVSGTILAQSLRHSKAARREGANQGARPDCKKSPRGTYKATCLLSACIGSNHSNRQKLVQIAFE